MKMKLKGALVAAMLLVPSAALAAPGIVTASVGMRAGPGSGFPIVDRIPGGAHVNIHGCIRGDAWCDVSWSDDRGWVSSRYLEYLYRNRYVYLPDYVDVIDVPVVPFVLGSYWASYYSGRPWYHRRAYWSSYWDSHAREATIPVGRNARFGRTETRPPMTGGRAREGLVQGRTAGVAQGAVRERSFGREGGFAQQRGAAAEQQRLSRMNGAGRAFRSGPQPMARIHEAPRFSAAPAARPAMPHVAQPNVGRFSGPPMAAHAQMGAPRAMPGGGAPHVNAAPRVGGAPAGRPAPGGPPGHQGR